jgi:Uncharacterized protein conserved in bacteria
MSELINIGYGNQVSVDKLVAVITPDSAPIKRLIQSAKDNGMLIDATQGRRTRAVLIMNSEHIVLSAILPDTIATRISPVYKNDIIHSKEMEDE